MDNSASLCASQFFFLSMLLLPSNNVQVLKIVALVQDSNLIIGKVHGLLMLYAS